MNAREASAVTDSRGARLLILLSAFGLFLAVTLTASAVSVPLGAPLGLTPTGEPPTPTATSIPPTSTPTPVAVALAVTLQRPNALPPAPSWAVPITLALYAPGDPTALLYQWRLTLDQGGRWNGSLEIASGIYDVRLHNLHTLRNVKRNVTISGSLTLNMGTLHEGDADGDNRVRSGDFALLRAAYFTQPGDPTFDARTDFDEDQRVRSGDFALLRGNYFETGDIEVPAALTAARAGAPADRVAISLEPALTTVAASDWVTLTLMAHAGAQDFVALDADIRFPPGVLQVVGPDGEPATAIQPLPALATLLRNDADNATGRILYGAGLFTGVANGDVAVALVRFRVARGGTAVIHLHDATVAAADGRDVTGALTDARMVSRGGPGYFPLIFGGQTGGEHAR